MAIAVPFRAWFDAECARRGNYKLSWLVRESGCSYATVGKALSGEPIGTQAAARLSDASGRAVSEVSLLQLAKRPRRAS